ncbi:MAG: hypothetical protein KBS59_05990, partial [Clostridiales bacterium]|nr:hypothetical protein [Clostridiales bacterium]
MTIENAKKIYLDVREKTNAFGLCYYLSSLDIETETVPRGAMDFRAKQLSVLNSLIYDMTTSAEYTEAIETLKAGKDTLDADFAHEIDGVSEGMEKLKKTPKDEYIEFQELCTKAYPAYVDAKLSSDFSKFEPYLDKIFKYNRKYVKWVGGEKQGYDVLLDEYEHGYTAEDYDKFFGVLKDELVPFVKNVTDKTREIPDFAKKTYPADKQKEFCEYLRGVMCFDPEYTAILESEHPFTSNNGSHDVRITNHYYEDNLISSIFSAIHEMGHGLYELQVDEKYEG